MNLDYKVRCLDDLSTGNPKHVEMFEGNPNYTFIKGDIKDLDTCMKACEGVDYVLNQAGAQNTDPNARIRLNPNAKITIDELGNIYQNDQLVTRIGVVDFDDYNYISKYGENLYDLVDGGQITASDAKVQQGCIEGSNVNVVDEMVKMITISRAYQAGQKVINTVDETLDKTVNQVGKV